MALPTSFKRAKSRGNTGSSRTSSLMRLAMESAHTAKFTRAPAKKTLRSRQVTASSKRPMGRQFSTISSGWRRKLATTVRSALGWHQRASSVMQPARATAASSVAHRGRRYFGRRLEVFKPSGPLFQKSVIYLLYGFCGKKQGWAKTASFPRDAGENRRSPGSCFFRRGKRLDGVKDGEKQKLAKPAADRIEGRAHVCA